MPFPRLCLASILLAFLSLAPSSNAQISKGQQILLDRGFQIMALTQPDNYFHFDTYTNAGYTTISFSFDSTGNLGPISTFTGDAPGFPWARWAPNETNMPGMGSGTTGNGVTYSRENEIPHLSQLVAIQLADEWNLNDDAVRTRLVNWVNAERTNWPTSILYHNNWGYQIGDAQLFDYINRAHPDMLSFDTYPWESVWDINAPNHIGAAIPGPGSFQLKQWYSELRQYREYAKAFNIPLAIYRHVWHGVQDYDQHVYRDPSFSELRLNTFAAIAFNTKFINDFMYNSSAGSMFTKIYNGSGDTQTNVNGLYAEMGEVNKQVRNWGNTLVRLKPIGVEAVSGYTTSMMFIRGKAADGNLTTIPDGFVGDMDSGWNNALYTDWDYQRNDPYLTNNWVVTNLGTKNNGYPGDVIVSWFKPLDESFDGPNYTNEIYMMVVNGLTDPTGTAADCLQQITFNFHSSLAGVEMLNPQTGAAELQMLPLTNGLRQMVLNLKGGEAVLFKFANGAPFVGSQLTPVTGAPVITIHPASCVSVLGTTANFTVRALGSAPLSYRWQFNGVDITGATTENFTRSGVQSVDAGNYSVIVSNSFGVVASTIASLSISNTALLYEPFNYTNFGGPVTANVPANWVLGAGTLANDLNVTPGNLSYAGLKASSGNSVTNGGSGLGVRRLLGSAVSSGSLYFSALFKINNLGYGASGWNGAASQMGALTASDNTSFRLAIMARSNSPSGYVIGVQKGGTGATPTYSTTEYHTNDTLFLVGKYDFNTSPNTVSLWINPDPSFFLGNSAPFNFITSTNGTDGLTIDRFNLRQNTAGSVPATMQWDDLRAGRTWADVTAAPPSFVGTVSDVVRFSGASGQGTNVYASTNLINWLPIGGATEIAPGLYQFIDSGAANGAQRFYQLRAQ